MPDRPPPLGQELRLGRRALEAIEGFELLEDFQWYGGGGYWRLRCRLTVPIQPGGLVPEVTDWYLLVHPDYPAGWIKLLPARDGGLAVTFPHQAFNGEGNKELPWRGGALCLDSEVAVLRRQGGLDRQPRTAGARLAWQIRQALRWLDLASRDRLLETGHYFELPDYPIPAGSKTLLVFSESASSLAAWRDSPARSGYVELSRVEAAHPLLLVRSFQTADGREILATSWGNHLLLHSQPAPLGAWILVDHPIALRPWQAPATWEELRSQLAGQDVDLKRRLELLSPRLRDHELPLEKRPRHALLLGFPIPEKVGGSPARIHWQAVELPVLSAGDYFTKGCRKREKGYRWRDALLRRKNPSLRWIRSECWDKDELSGRGRLGGSLRGRKVALLGAGALGSAFGELLVRGGVDDLTVLDLDVLEAENLVRHTLGWADVRVNKAEALARKLNLAAPSSSVNGIGYGFPHSLFDGDEAEIIVDATGEDDVLFHLQRYPWKREHWFLSLWVGMHARRIYGFSCRGTAFPAEACLELFEEWRQRERLEFSAEKPLRPGIGCWHPVFPSRADDIHLAASLLIKHFERVLARGEEDPLLAVYEQSPDPDSPGVRRVQ